MSNPIRRKKETGEDDFENYFLNQECMVKLNYKKRSITLMYLNIGYLFICLWSKIQKIVSGVDC